MVVGSVWWRRSSLRQQHTTLSLIGVRPAAPHAWPSAGFVTTGPGGAAARPSATPLASKSGRQRAAALRPPSEWQAEGPNEWNTEYAFPGKAGAFKLTVALHRNSSRCGPLNGAGAALARRVAGRGATCAEAHCSRVHRVFVHASEAGNLNNIQVLGLTLETYVPDGGALRTAKRWDEVLRSSKQLVRYMDEHVVQPLLLHAANGDAPALSSAGTSIATARCVKRLVGRPPPRAPALREGPAAPAPDCGSDSAAAAAAACCCLLQRSGLAAAARPGGAAASAPAGHWHHAGRQRRSSGEVVDGAKGPSSSFSPAVMMMQLSIVRVHACAWARVGAPAAPCKRRAAHCPLVAVTMAAAGEGQLIAVIADEVRVSLGPAPWRRLASPSPIATSSNSVATPARSRKRCNQARCRAPRSGDRRVAPVPWGHHAKGAGGTVPRFVGARL